MVSIPCEGVDYMPGSRVPARPGLATTREVDPVANDHSTRTPHERKAKPAGWAKIPHEIALDSRLKGCDFRVLARLAYHARDSGVCWPSVATLARDLDLGRRTVQIALKRLQGLGYVASEPAPQRATGRQLRLSLGGSAVADCAPPASGIAPPPRVQPAPPPMTEAAPELDPVPEGQSRTNPPLPGPGTISRLPGTERQTASRPPRKAGPLTPLEKLLVRFMEQDCRPEWMAKVLAEDFADGHSYDFYLKVARERPWVIPEAYEAARKAGTDSPVKMFAAVASRPAVASASSRSRSSPVPSWSARPPRG